METKVSVAIIGSGPAGYTAAIYSARAGRNPVIITGMEFGGQIVKTFDLENYPGFTEKIDGVYLTEQMRQQAEIFGAKIITDTVTSVDFKTKPFKLNLENGDTIIADSVIIATGAKTKKLGIENEDKFTSRGLSYCATCDGFFFKNKEVFLIGGGNSAVYEALHLATLCKQVNIVHRRDFFTAEKIMQNHLFNTPNISVLWNNEVVEFTGDEKLTGLKLKNTITGEIATYNTDGVFVAVGNTPVTDIFKGQIDLTDTGYIKTKPDSAKTNIDGIFAAGDVKNPQFKQVVIACGDGAKAAMEVESYFLSQK